ncbi:AAA family ATPase [Streptomyces sp. NPDC049555]|uniref:AAA family ATPase n=1 Tax=Streptomyces sp. NPDC049555 TaxID=3154930 RepID=UPI00341D8DA9
MSTTAAPKLRTRQPTGIIPWPKVIVEGPEKVGKTFEGARFTGSPKTGQAFWLELGEDSADEYISVPGADYVIIEHDGTYRDILGQLEAVHAEARRAARAGEPPVVLVIDSMSALWRMLINWTHERARRSNSAQRKLRFDPDAEIKPAMNLWNDANERWNRAMYLIRTMPAIVIMIARGKEVTAVDEDGNPVPGTKEWRVEAQKHLAFDATVWVRLLPGEDHAHIVAARSLRLQVPREGKPKPIANFSLEHLVFDLLGCAPHTQPRQAPELTGDLAQRWLKRVDEAAEKQGREGLQKLWKQVGASKELSHDEVKVVQAAIERAAAELKNPRTMDDPLQDATSDAAKLRAAAAEADTGDESEPFDDAEAVSA